MKRSIRFLSLLVLALWTGGNAWALEQDSNGVYQIGTAQDLAEFANLVNSARQYGINAVLTADIDFTANSEMIGVEGKPYNGTFDGQGHKVTIAYNTTANETALFRRTNGATIKNLAVAGTITTTGQFAGGIISGVWETTTLEGCTSSVVISDTQSGDGTHGGLIARLSNTNSVTIKNCAFTGELNAPNRTGSGGILGWPDNGGTKVQIQNCLVSGTINLVQDNNNNDIIVRNSATVTNCYFINANGQKNSKGAIQATTEQASSGELCFKLNGNQSDNVAWFQTLGTDNEPSPIGTDVVYAIGALDCAGNAKGDVSYSNTFSEPTRDDHQWNDWGFCTNCNEMQPDFLTLEDGYYLISNKYEYNWFMVYVNNGHADANAKLTQDLDLSDYTFVSIGNDANRYHGTFDGQCFRIKNMTISGTTKELGFFNVCSNATIKNLILDASCNINSGDCTAALVGCCNGSGTLAIENVGVECNVTGTGPNAAAFVGCNYGGIAIQIKNCYNTGNITAGHESAVFSGWFGNNGSAKVENSWNTGKVTGQDGQNSLGRGIGASQFVNTYDLNSKNNGISETVLADYTAEWLTSGQLAYVLNGNKSENVSWYQLIGTDEHPYPFGEAIVYAGGDKNCDGTPKGDTAFSNTQGGNQDPHQFGEWGFCTVCDAIQPEFAALEDGVYQITNAKELNWLAVWTDREDASVKAVMTQDIDMSEVPNFPGLGSGTRNFTGEFDGQRHILSNLKMEWTDRNEGVGFVNRAASGAKVKNLTIANSCSFKGNKAVAGIIGGLYGGGDVYIENCGNEGAVESTGQNAGGIVGVCFNGTILHLTNVYNIGTITGATAGESGSLSGWMANAVIENCYSVAGYPTAEDTHGFQQGNQFARGSGIKLTNCYDFGTGDWGTNNGDWGSAFGDGRKIADADDETEMSRVFAGLFDGDGGNVWRMEYNGDWPHPVLYDTDVVLKENNYNRFVAADDVDLTLVRTTVAGTWNTICLPFDVADPTTLFGTGAKVAELQSLEGTTLKFSVVNAIEAGKPYLVLPTEAMTEKALTGVSLVAGTTDVPAGDLTFTGVYDPTAAAAGSLFISTGNKLSESNGEGTIKAFRAYFQVAEGGAKAVDFVVDDVATGIINIDGTVLTDGSTYDLQGRRVSIGSANAKPARGLYIVNGKKTIVK